MSYNSFCFCIIKISFANPQLVKNLLAVQETQVQFQGWEDPLEKGMATHSSNSCLENPHGQRSLAGYSPWGREESDTTERLTTAQKSMCLGLR